MTFLNSSLRYLKSDRLERECNTLNLVLNSPIHPFNLDSLIREYIDRRLYDGEEGFSFLDRVRELKVTDDDIINIDNIRKVLNYCKQTNFTGDGFAALDEAVLEFIQRRFSSADTNELKDYVHRLQNPTELKINEILGNSGLLNYINNRKIS